MNDLLEIMVESKREPDAEGFDVLIKGQQAVENLWGVWGLEVARVGEYFLFWFYFWPPVWQTSGG